MKADELIRQAVVAMQAGNREQAGRLLEQALAADPEHAGALIASAKMAQAGGDSERALAFLDRLLAVAPTSLSALVMQGHIYYSRGEAEQAQTAFHHARSLAPDSDALAFNEGVMLYSQARYAEAASAYDDALRLNPDNDDSRRNRIMSLAGAGETDATLDSCADYLARRRGRAWNGDEPDIPELPEGDRQTTRFKLQHDLEQLRYLAETVTGQDFHEWIAAFENALDELSALDVNERFDRSIRHGAHWDVVNRIYNRPVWLPAPELPDGPLINPDLDVVALEDRYLGDGPPVTVADGLLTPPVLAALRDFLRAATIWYDIKPNYLGAYFIEGFANRLTLGIAEALRLALPRVFGNHRLTQAWAYKYGPELSGIPMHADAAAVNVNFWVAPGDANLDPASGGLKVYTAQAPKDWDFARFNNDQAAIGELLDQHGRECVTVPHAENRAVIFHSSLFHETDRICFRDDYLGRRINVTLLYGQRDV